MRGKHRTTRKRVQIGAGVLSLALMTYVLGFLAVKHPGFSTTSPEVSSTLRYVTAQGNPGSHNVTNKGPGNADPTELVGDQYECTMTDPEMALTNDSESGTVALLSSPKSLAFSIAQGGSDGYWNDAYLAEGNNSYGFNSGRCNSYGYGHSLALPSSFANLPNLTASTTMTTGSGFQGDAGFDIWLTGTGQYDSWGTTSTEIKSSENSTELMVWLNSPGAGRSGYTSLGKVSAGGVTWDVFYYNKHSARHLWNYVVFASPDRTSTAHTFTYTNLPLSSFIKYTIDKGLTQDNPVIQSVDAGFEWFSDPGPGTGVDSYALSETGGASLPYTVSPMASPGAKSSCSG